MAQTRKPRSDLRPVPADFAKVAPTMSARGLFRHYRTSPAVVRRWKRETGIETIDYKPPAPDKRPIPADFAERAPTTTARALQKHYKTGFRIIVRWAKESGVQPLTGTRHGARPVPDDFRERAATSCTAHLIAHYECTADAIKRWSRLTGVVPPIGRRQYPPRAVKAPVVRRAADRTNAGPSGACFNTLRRDTTTEGMAADHLRKYCAVYRCTPRGAADQQGTHWRYGNAVLTPAELIARAERNGFDAQAWRHIPNISRQAMPQQAGA